MKLVKLRSTLNTDIWVNLDTVTHIEPIAGMEIPRDWLIGFGIMSVKVRESEALKILEEYGQPPESEKRSDMRLREN